MDSLLENRSARQTSIGTKRIYAFACGELGTTLSWNMLSGFILYYYSNVALLPIASVGTLLLITRIMDALIDPAIGVAVDKTRSGKGRARPWLLFAGVPFGMLAVLTFSVPAWGAGGKLIYAYLTFTIAGFCFSGLYVPYNALTPLMTSVPADKLRIGSMRAVASSIGSIIIYSLMMPLVSFFGEGNAQRGFTIASAVVASATVALALVVFWFCPERMDGHRVIATEPIWRGVRDMLRNRTWLVVTGLALTMFFRLGSLVSVAPYFAIDVLRSPSAIGLLLSSLSVSVLIGGVLAKPLLARLGKRRGNVIGLVLGIVLSLLQAAIVENRVLFTFLYFVGNITLGILVTTVFTMIADAVDAQEAEFGSRNEGLLTSTVSFAQKAGMAVGGSVIAYGLAFVGYDPASVSAAARTGETALFFGAPTLFAAMQLVIILFYKEARDEARR